MKLITWNMQGASNFVDCASLLATADILCLQECGLPPSNWGVDVTSDDADGLYMGSFKRHVGRDDLQFHITYVKWTKDPQDPKNPRCSLCVITRRPPKDKKVIPDPNPNPTRPMVGVRVDDLNGLPCWVFSAHTKSSGTTPKHRGEIVDHLASALSSVGAGSVLFAGDFNYDASAWVSPKWAVQIAGPGPTQKSGGNLDWALVRPASANHARVPQALAWTTMSVFSDHFAQEFDLTW